MPKHVGLTEKWWKSIIRILEIFDCIFPAIVVFQYQQVTLGHGSVTSALHEQQTLESAARLSTHSASFNCLPLKTVCLLQTHFFSYEAYRINTVNLFLYFLVKYIYIYILVSLPNLLSRNKRHIIIKDNANSATTLFRSRLKFSFTNISNFHSKTF